MAKRKSDFNIPERFLRQIWKNQNFSSHNLHTLNGQSVEIISPGKLNYDGGPDFMDASIRINGILYRGDIEIHQRNNEWAEHRHHEDPKYNSVILHVILVTDSETHPPTTLSKRTIPILVLSNYLTTGFRSIWEQMIFDERAERLCTMKCFSHNDSVSPADLNKLFNKLAIERIELKVRRFEERLKEMINEKQLHIKEPPARYSEIPFGLNPEELPSPIPKYSAKDFRNIHIWEQLLYEGTMEALGYSKNQTPFLKLSRNVTLKFLDEVHSSLPDVERNLHYESILFSVAGLLPKHGEIKDSESKKYIHKLKSIWKQYIKLYRKEFLNKSEWQFFRLRPDNFPTIRIAGAARLIQKFSKESLFKSIIQTTKSRDKDNRAKYSMLADLFIVPAYGFWIKHYLFDEASNKTMSSSIGKSRADEIILNVVIPICLLYARIFKDKEVRHGTLKIFEQSPPLSQNTIIKTIDSQIVKGKLKLQTGMMQQGILQLYKFYCSENRCDDCLIGKTSNV